MLGTDNIRMDVWPFY